MSQPPPDVQTAVELRIQAVAEFLSYIQSTHRLAVDDEKDWTRTLIRAFSDLAKDASDACQDLSTQAVKRRVLTPSQAADAERITASAVHARIKRLSES